MGNTVENKQVYQSSQKEQTSNNLVIVASSPSVAPKDVVGISQEPNSTQGFDANKDLPGVAKPQHDQFGEKERSAVLAVLEAFARFQNVLAHHRRDAGINAMLSEFNAIGEVVKKIEEGALADLIGSMLKGTVSLAAGGIQLGFSIAANKPGVSESKSMALSGKGMAIGMMGQGVSQWLGSPFDFWSKMTEAEREKIQQGLTIMRNALANYNESSSEANKHADSGNLSQIINALNDIERKVAQFV